MLWWGVAIFACGTPGGYKHLYSALFITLLLRYVSGVPFLEKKQMKKAAFRVYAKETSVFVPWFYKKIEGTERQGLLAKFE